jgi:hypothetical protein
MATMIDTQRRPRAAAAKAHPRDLPTLRDRILFGLGLAAMLLLIVALNLATANNPRLGAGHLIMHENVHA